ncbi:MAG: AP2 domain-containing protein [Planctomycetota bacterium]|jgi:hypothetical protein
MPQRPEKRQCRHCYFCRSVADTLHCVKNPPALDPDTRQACWPIVKQDDICGAFRFTDENHIETDHWPRNELPIYKDHLGDYCRIPLTQGKFTKVDPEDYIWLLQFRWHCHKREYTYYALRTQWQHGVSKKILMHRLIANTPVHLVCDHINRDGLDNRKQNLRNCTKQQNNLNQAGHRDSVSRYKGVYWKKDMQKWVASIQIDATREHLGYFDSETEAAKTYDKAAKKLHGDFAGLNFTYQ